MADIKLVLNLVNYNDVYNKLKNINSALQGLGTIAKGLRPVATTVSFLFSSMTKSVTRFVRDMARTLRSAILRTAAYGLINIFRDINRSIKNYMKDTQQQFLNFARASAIMTKGGFTFSDTLSKMKRISLDASKNVALTSNSIANIAVSLSKAGINLNQYEKMLQALSDAQLVTGEDAKELALDLVRLATAFKVPAEDFRKLVAILVVGSTDAVGTIRGLVQASKYLAPVIVNTYGTGIDSVKSFTAAVMAGTAAGAESTHIARWLRTALIRMMAPSGRAARLMKMYGIELYKADGKARTYAERMKTLGDKMLNLERTINKLVAEENKLRLENRAEEADKLAEKISALKDQFNSYGDAVDSLYTLFTQAGGKFRPLNEVIAEFAKLKDKIGALEFQRILEEMFSIRQSQGVQTLSLQVDKMVGIFGDLETAMSKFNRMVSKILDTAPGKVEVFRTSLTKLKTVIGALGLETLWAPIADALTKYVITPITQFLMKPEIQNIMKKYGERISEDIKNIFELLRNPEKYAKREFEIELKIRWEKLLSDLSTVINGIWKLFKIAGIEAGRLFGKGFKEAVTPEILKTTYKWMPWEAYKRYTAPEFKYKFWTEHPGFMKFLHGEKKYYETLEKLRQKIEQRRLQEMESLVNISSVVAETVKQLQEQLATGGKIEKGKKLFTADEIAKSLSKYYDSIYIIGDAVVTNAKEAVRVAAKTNENIRIYGSNTIVSLKELGVNLEKYLKTMQEEYLNLNESVKRLHNMLESTRNRRKF